MKTLIIILAAVIVVAGSGVVGVAIHSNQPEVVVRNAILGAVEDLLKRDEIAPLVSMLEKGSLEIGLKLDSKELAFVDSGIGDLTAGGKIYFSDDSLMLDDLFVSADKITFEGEAYLSEDLIYVANDDVLEGGYGVIRGKMEKAFNNSELIESLNIPDEMIDTIAKVLEQYDKGVDKDLQKDMTKYMEKYLRVAIEALEENAEYEAETDKVRLAGERFEARVVTVKISAETVVAVFEELYDELYDDSRLRKTLIGYTEDYEEYFEDQGIDVEEMYDEALEEMGDAIDEMDPDEDAGFILRVVTPKMSSKLLGISAEAWEEDDKTELFSLEFGSDGPAKSQLISLEIEGYTTIEYEITSDSSKEYEAVLRLSQGKDGPEVDLFKLSIDKKKDEFRLTAPSMELTLSGDWETKGGKTSVTVDKIRLYEETIKGFELSVIIREKDNMPSHLSKGKVTNVLLLTEKDAEEIVERFNKKIAGELEEKEDVPEDVPDDDISESPSWNLKETDPEPVIPTPTEPSTGLPDIWDDIPSFTFAPATDLVDNCITASVSVVNYDGREVFYRGDYKYTWADLKPTGMRFLENMITEGDTHIGVSYNDNGGLLSVNIPNGWGVDVYQPGTVQINGRSYNTYWECTIRHADGSADTCDADELADYVLSNDDLLVLELMY